MLTSKNADTNPVIIRQVNALKDKHYIKILEYTRKQKRIIGIFLDVIFFYFKLSFVIRKEHFDVVHCHDMHTLIVGTMIAKLKRKKLIYDVHDIYYFNDSLPVKKILKFIDLLFAKLSNYIIVPCIDFKKYFKKVNPNVIVIYNAPPIDLYKPMPKKDNTFVISYLGTIRNTSTFKTLFESVKNMNDVNVMVTKMGGLSERITKLSEDYNNVIMLEPTDENGIIKRYQNSDCLYCVYPENSPPILYSVPMKIFDAMSIGIPVITNDIGFTGDFVNKYNIGITVKANDVKELTAKIILLKDTNSKYVKGMNGRMLAESYFNWKSQKEKLFMVFNKVR